MSTTPPPPNSSLPPLPDDVDLDELGHRLLTDLSPAQVQEYVPECLPAGKVYSWRMFPETDDQDEALWKATEVAHAAVDLAVSMHKRGHVPDAWEGLLYTVRAGSSSPLNLGDIDIQRAALKVAETTFFPSAARAMPHLTRMSTAYAPAGFWLPGSAVRSRPDGNFELWFGPEVQWVPVQAVPGRPGPDVSTWIGAQWMNESTGWRLYAAAVA